MEYSKLWQLGEPVYFDFILVQKGIVINDITPSLELRRISDNFFYDFNTHQFSNDENSEYKEINMTSLGVDKGFRHTLTFYSEVNLRAVYRVVYNSSIYGSEDFFISNIKGYKPTHSVVFNPETLEVFLAVQLTDKLNKKVEDVTSCVISVNEMKLSSSSVVLDNISINTNYDNTYIYKFLLESIPVDSIYSLDISMVYNQVTYVLNSYLLRQDQYENNSQINLDLSGVPNSVWSYANRSLSNPGLYKADTTALAKEATLESLGSTINLVKDNTNSIRLTTEQVKTISLAIQTYLLENLIDNNDNTKFI
jgi:hypothetical protein